MMVEKPENTAGFSTIIQGGQGARLFRQRGFLPGPRTWLLGALLAVGVCSFVVVRGEQGDGGAFLARQRAVRPLTAAAVDRVIVAAPDPVTRARGLAARCAALGRRALMNHWRCLIAYRSGRRIQYLVTVHADGSYLGDHELVVFRGRRYSDTGTIEGCCIAIP